MNCCCFYFLLLLLLHTLNFCRYDVVAQSSYQAEENQNTTLEWPFNTGSSEPDVVCCERFTDGKPSVLYYLHEGGEQPHHDQFAGRVQCDRDALREGRVRLNVSRLRTEDSGAYRCRVKSNGWWHFLVESHLKVTAAAAQPETQRPTERPGSKSSRPVSRGRIALYVPLGAAAAASVLLVSLCYCSNVSAFHV